MSAVARLHHRPVTSDEPHCGRSRRSISGSKAGRGSGAPKLGTYRPTRTGATTPVRGGRQRDSRALRLPRSSPGPFGGEGAVESLDLPVGLGPVGPGPLVLDAVRSPGDELLSLDGSAGDDLPK